MASDDNQPRELSGGQRRFLRGLGHHLRPLATVGRMGIDAGLLKTLEDILAAHELVKVRIGNNCPVSRREAAAALAAASGSALVQVLGRTVLLYRANPDRPGDKRIKLPGGDRHA